MAKVIDAPDAVDCVIGANVVRMTFKMFLTQAMDGHEPSGQGLANIRKAVKIVDKIEKMDGALALEDEEYNTIKAAIGAAKWMPSAARAMLPFMEAVESAQEVSIPTKK
jgi:hypothetical protein